MVGALFVAMALVSCAFLTRERTGGTLAASIAVADSPRTYFETRDSDGDGMRDWEEDLYGTNPKTPDALARPTTTAAVKETIDDLPDTVTKQFAISFMSDYIAKHGANSAFDDAAKQEFLDEAVDYAQAETADRPFTAADLNVSGDSSPTAVRAYGNELARALTEHSISSRENELAILERALQSDDPADLAGLAEIRDSYQQTLSDVLVMPAPESLVAEHLELLNTVLALHNNVAAFERSFDDALPAMVRFQRYPSDIEHLRQILSAISARLRERGATYSKEEPGSFFTLFVQ